MKKFLSLILFAGCWSPAFTQIEWQNYSTTYLGEGSDSVPLLVTAIPYNGIYSLGDRSPLDITYTGSDYHFRSNLDKEQVLHTYDSADVNFLAPGLFPSNAGSYEFRVLKDNNTVLKDWSMATSFTDIQLNQFRKGFAFLGGYKTNWDHFITVELRKKGSQKNLSSTTVYWRQVKPAILSVLTSSELNERLLRTREPFDISSYTGEADKLQVNKQLSAGEKELIIFIEATIYKKEALEYQLKKNGKTIRPWAANDVDNNFIWLRDLEPGDYSIDIRFRKQRHNVTSYSFAIQYAWYQTLLFKFAMIVLAVIMLGFFTMLYLFRRQKRKTAAQQAIQGRLQLELKSVYSQLNPHFIFNALSSIQGLINKNDIAGANHYLSAFGNLVRHSLTSSEKTFIPLEQELKTLETYLSLEQLRFNFAYTISYNDLPVSEIDTPPLLLQPLLENAVKHGVASLQEKGNIDLLFEKQQNDLLVKIRDNGKGISNSEKQDGYGLKLTRNRIELLNELSSHRKILMEIQNSNGSLVTLLFKNWLS